ncbi:hypothetical protein [Citrobacter gillenii]|uniref:hypothetical protein n=1 Tax=Citrobacter gillenii TaxID=67828 RepID=UPI0022E00106|nr:hypothetical protein [Citrobacter gillenii]
MSAVTNTVKNDDLDELTAMLQSLDEPVQKAAKISGVDEIDDLLSGLDDAIAKPVEAVADEVMNASSTDDLSSVLEALEIEHESVKVEEPERDLIAEIVNEPAPELDARSTKTTGTDPTPLPSVASEPKPEEEQPKRQKAKSERAPAKSRFTLEGKDESFYATAGLESESFTAAFEGAPVKAKDKILNLLNWFSGGPEISVYTVIAMRHILDANTATSNSIKLALMSNPEKPYPLNTASTQAGQMMAVFPATGIATREGGNLTLNKESPIVKKFIAEYSIG